MGPGCYLGIQSPSNQPNTRGRTRPQTPPIPPFPGSCGCQALQRPQLLITAERNEEALVVSGCGAPQGRSLRPASHPHSQGPGCGCSMALELPTTTTPSPAQRDFKDIKRKFWSVLLSAPSVSGQVIETPFPGVVAGRVPLARPQIPSVQGENTGSFQSCRGKGGWARGATSLPRPPSSRLNEGAPNSLQR